MKSICFVNYNEPPGAKWELIHRQSKEGDYHFATNFLVSAQGYKGHISQKAYLDTHQPPIWLRFLPQKLAFTLSVSFSAEMKKADLLVLLSQPPFGFFFWALVCRIRRQPYVLYCMDLYPEVFFDVTKNKSVTERVIYGLLKRTYRKAQKVIVIGRDMKQLIIRNYGVSENRILFQRNWACL